MIERPLPNPDPPSSLSRGRRTLAILGVVLLFVLMSLRRLATFWTDYLWFDSIGFSAVWTTLVFSKVVLVLLASAAAFTLMFLNLVLADRLAPRQSLVAGSPDEEIVERFQGWVSRVLKFRLAVSGFFGLLIGLGAGAWWEDWLLYQNRQSFGTTDPVFGNDLGYYIFETPFYRDLFGWGFQFFLITLLVVTALHYLNGGIQVQPRRQRVAPGVKAHLSVLVAIIALLKAGGYWLDRYDLLYSSRGAVFGATYTDVNAQLPALNLLIGISIVAAVLLLVNIRFRGGRFRRSRSDSGWSPRWHSAESGPPWSSVSRCSPTRSTRNSRSSSATSPSPGRVTASTTWKCVASPRTRTSMLPLSITAPRPSTTSVCGIPPCC